MKPQYGAGTQGAFEPVGGVVFEISVSDRQDSIDEPGDGTGTGR